MRTVMYTWRKSKCSLSHRFNTLNDTFVCLGHSSGSCTVVLAICRITCSHFFPSDVPLVSTLVSAPYSGCMEVHINGHSVDLDRAIHKHNDIRSHSCPLLDSLQWQKHQSAKTDPYAVHSGNGDDFQYIYKSFDQWGDVLLECKKQKNKRHTNTKNGPGIVVQLGALAQDHPVL